MLGPQPQCLEWLISNTAEVQIMLKCFAACFNMNLLELFLSEGVPHFHYHNRNTEVWYPETDKKEAQQNLS
jgi:hypothetical protein